MPYTIQPINPLTDAPSLARTMITAMYQAPHWRLLWPTHPLEEIIGDMALRLPYNLTQKRHKLRHQKVIDTATGEIVGYARWILPEVEGKGYEESWLEARVGEVSVEDAAAFEVRRQGGLGEDGRPRGADTEMVDAMSGVLEVEEERIMGGEGEFLSLDYLTTLPSHQRRGIASLLVRSGLTVADQMGWRTIVMSMPAGKVVYEKLGFELVSSFDQDDSMYGGDGHRLMYFLTRDPKCKPQSEV